MYTQRKRDHKTGVDPNRSSQKRLEQSKKKSEDATKQLHKATRNASSRPSIPVPKEVFTRVPKEVLIEFTVCDKVSLEPITRNPIKIGFILSAQTPLTSLNFGMFCSGFEIGSGEVLEYKNTVVHAFKDTHIQFGDLIEGKIGFTEGKITLIPDVDKVGTGSISVYGQRFHDENFKLHHKKGTLSMANSGPNTNGCQIILTTSPLLQDCDGQNVVFGEVKGESMAGIDQLHQYGSKGQYIVYISKATVIHRYNIDELIEGYRLSRVSNLIVQPSVPNVILKPSHLNVPKEAWIEFSIGDQETIPPLRVNFILYADTPLTSSSFGAFCLGFETHDGTYLAYKNTLVHRIIPGFICQFGDVIEGKIEFDGEKITTMPDADKVGTGCINLYGETLHDENFKYQHDAAGTLSMANYGPNTNGCQVFVAASPCEYLDGKNVVFGKVKDDGKSMANINQLDQYGSNNGMVGRIVYISGAGVSKWYREEDVTNTVLAAYKALE